MNGKPYSTAAKVRRVGEEVPRTYSQRYPREWWAQPEAWTTWSWDETFDQYQTFRKTKSQI